MNQILERNIRVSLSLTRRRPLLFRGGEATLMVRSSLRRGVDLLVRRPAAARPDLQVGLAVGHVGDREAPLLVERREERRVDHDHRDHDVRVLAVADHVAAEASKRWRRVPPGGSVSSGITLGVSGVESSWRTLPVFLISMTEPGPTTTSRGRASRPPSSMVTVRAGGGLRPLDVLEHDDGLGLGAARVLDRDVAVLEPPVAVEEPRRARRCRAASPTRERFPPGRQATSERDRSDAEEGPQCLHPTARAGGQVRQRNRETGQQRARVTRESQREECSRLARRFLLCQRAIARSCRSGRRCVRYPSRRKMTDPPEQDPGDLPQPEARARLRDPVRLPRVHLSLPQDRAARLRDHPRRVRARRAVRRAQVVEALPLVVPRRGRVSRGGHQPDPRRPGGRDSPAPRARRRRLQRPRRHHDDHRRRAPEEAKTLSPDGGEGLAEGPCGLQQLHRGYFFFFLPPLALAGFALPLPLPALAAGRRAPPPRRRRRARPRPRRRRRGSG